MGRSFIRKHLCTLEMARKWVPDAPSHSLGKLCDYLGIRLKDRHRAHGDAEATAQLLKQLLSVHREDAARAFIKHERSDALPSHLPLQSLQKLPHLPGVYYFTNKEGRTVYIGHGPNLRVSAWRKLQEAPRKRRNGKKLLQSVHDIHYVETGSESLAQLHAYLERIRMQPRYNTRAYRRKDDIQIPVVVDGDVDQVRDVLVFDGWTQARRQLQRWSQKHGFCLPGMRPLRITCPQCRQAACRWDASGRPRPELWLSQQQYETLAREWRFSGNQLLMELRGRDAEERGLILIRDGALAAYGWLSMDRSFFHPDELLQELIPCHDSFETRQVVHQCIKRKGYLSLKPLEHYLASATDEPAISRNL